MKRIKMTVTMDVTPAQALALQAMFEYWTYCGKVGMSRQVGFYVDGDGNFRPNCMVSVDGDLPELTDELRELAVVWDSHGDRLYDSNFVAWKLAELGGAKDEQHA